MRGLRRWVSFWGAIASILALVLFILFEALERIGIRLVFEFSWLFVTQILGFALLAYLLWRLERAQKMLPGQIAILLRAILMPGGGSQHRSAPSRRPEGPPQAPKTSGSGAFGGMVAGGLIGLALWGPPGVLLGGIIGALFGDYLEARERRQGPPPGGNR